MGARIIARPSATVYRVVSSSSPGKADTLTSEGGDVTCSWLGFEYCGTRSHARNLKDALVQGTGLPEGVTAV